MKKILTASLVAMMAVTAARADIATTKYVNTQSGLPENQKTFSATDFAGVAAGKTNLKDAVNAIAGAVEGLNGTGTDSVAGKIETLKTDVIGTLAEGKTVVQMIEAAQSAGEGAAATAKTEAIAAAKTETTNQVAAAKTELGTTITNTAATTLADAKAYANGLAANYDAAGSAAAAETAAKAYTDELANGAVKTNTANIATNTTNIAKNTGAITTLNGDATTAGSVAKAVADAKSELQGEINKVVAGGLTPGSVEGTALKNGAVSETQLSTSVNASLDKADSAVQTVVTGAANGTISVDGTDVAVKGLGTAAYEALAAFATAAQGAKADAAMNWASIKDITWENAGCNGEGVVCSLVSKGGNIAWEKVVD